MLMVTSISTQVSHHFFRDDICHSYTSSFSLPLAGHLPLFVSEKSAVLLVVVVLALFRQGGGCSFAISSIGNRLKLDGPRVHPPHPCNPMVDC